MQVKWESSGLSMYVSKNGGITGDSIVEILKCFDNIDLFPHAYGRVISVLVVDGQQSR